MERLGAISAPILSSLILLSRCLQLSLPLPKVKSISAFHRVLYRNPPPPHSPKAQSPLQALQGKILQSLRQLLLPLLRLNPTLSRLLRQQEPSRPPLLPRIQFSSRHLPIKPPIWLAITACLAPEIAFAVHRLTGPVSLQQQTRTS